jgi:hypothetical protein
MLISPSDLPSLVSFSVSPLSFAAAAAAIVVETRATITLAERAAGANITGHFQRGYNSLTLISPGERILERNDGKTAMLELWNYAVLNAVWFPLYHIIQERRRAIQQWKGRGRRGRG